MKILITGGAGFIGSHLAEFLVAAGHDVSVLDNLSTGRAEHLAAIRDKITFFEADIRDKDAVDRAVKGQELVFHLCDNSDIQFSTRHPEVYIDQNVVSCFNLLQTMHRHGVRKIVFPSSSTVFGDATVVPTPENYGPLLPMNLYGGAKAACEALISAFVYSFDMQACIFRFVNIIGARMDHGVIFDFIRKLKNDPNRLLILGDGSQKRTYVLVDDCIDAIWTTVQNSRETVTITHITNSEQVQLTEVAKLIYTAMGLENVEFEFSGGKKGWKGDANTNFMSGATLERLGWKAKHDSRSAVSEATRRLVANWPL